MRFADGRKVKLVLRIVRLDEVVCNLVCEREKPNRSIQRKRPSATSAKRDGKKWDRPGYLRLLLVTVLDVRVVCQAGSLQLCLPRELTASTTLTPCLEIAQVDENASVPVERDESSCHVIKDVQRGQRKVVYLSERRHDVYEPRERVAHACHEGVGVGHIYSSFSNSDVVRFNVPVQSHLW